MSLSLITSNQRYVTLSKLQPRTVFTFLYLPSTTPNCHLAYSKFRYLKACSFASFIHSSLLGFGWKRVAINYGQKNPKDMLKKRRVSSSQSQMENLSRSTENPLGSYL
ncbi:hypothetical protein TNCV_2716441 [Trichonephila clavipes]|nr:hypothetical protein TNCV_2716441 [Trichonephila clavipes]